MSGYVTVMAALVAASPKRPVEDGVITEFGSHDELVATDGSYAALWDSWNGHLRES
jgi:hypothetical protein